MAIYLLEHKLKDTKEWKMKRRFTNEEEAFNMYNKMLGLFVWHRPHISYRVVKLMS